jgi:hypothetical protein
MHGCRRIATVAALAFAAVTAGAAQAEEPADDHPGGAVPVLGRVAGAIDHPGDVDWYVADVPLDQGYHANVRIAGGSCAPGAVQATVLNPEAKPFAWKPVSASRDTTLALPAFTPGKYYIVVDAAADPACSGVTYELEVAGLPFTGGIHTDMKGAGCRAARAQVNTDRVLLARFRAVAKAKHGAGRRRYLGYVHTWAGYLRKDKGTAQRECAR